MQTGSQALRDVVMLSNHSQDEVQPFIPWTERCKRRFPGAVIQGSGRWIVVPYDHVRVVAFEDYDSAILYMAGMEKWRLVDLADDPVHNVNLSCGNIKSQSDYEDRLWERRRERERRQTATP